MQLQPLILFLILKFKNLKTVYKKVANGFSSDGRSWFQNPLLQSDCRPTGRGGEEALGMRATCPANTQSGSHMGPTWELLGYLGPRNPTMGPTWGPHELSGAHITHMGPTRYPYGLSGLSAAQMGPTWDPCGRSRALRASYNRVFPQIATMEPNGTYVGYLPPLPPNFHSFVLNNIKAG